MIIRTPISREGIVRRYRNARFGESSNPAYKYIGYRMEIFLQKPHLTDIYDIPVIKMLRTWRSPNDDSWANYQWDYGVDEIDLKDSHFTGKSCEQIRRNDKWRILSLISLLALKAKYDDLRRLQHVGLIFRSDAFRLHKCPIWRGRSTNFDRITSKVKNLTNAEIYKGKSKECWLAKEFLLHPSELDNLLCWEGGGKDSGEKGYETVWTLNIAPEHIVVRVNGNEIPRRVLLELLTRVFPRDKLLSSERIRNYEEMVADNKRPQFAMNRLWDIAENLSQDMGWEEVDQIIIDRFGSQRQKEREDDDKASPSGAPHRPLENEIMRTELVMASTDVLRRYYAPSLEECAQFHFYSVGIDSEIIKTSVITNTRWLDICLPLKLGIPNFRRLEERSALPEMTLSRDVADKLIDIMCCSDKKLEDRNTFRLMSIDSNKKNLAFSFSEIGYMQFKLTYGLLETELHEALIGVELDASAVLNNRELHLPLRGVLLPDSHSMIELVARACTGGVAVVLAIARKEEGDFVIPVYRRSGKVARNQNLLSIAPSGVHQGDIEPDKEVNIFCTAKREFYEELLEKKQTEERITAKLRWDWFYTDSETLRWLRRNPESWHMELVSFGINTWSGGFGFGVLLAIHDTYFWDEFGGALDKNWEHQGLYKRLETKKRVEIADCVTRKDWADECQMIIAECINRLSVLYDDKCDIPRVERKAPV